MLKINKYEMINEDKIECFCLYNTKPVKAIVRKARQDGRCREVRNRYGFKSVAVMDDGYLIICPNYPEVYAERVDKERYIIVDPKRLIVSRNFVREVTRRPNTQQRREIIEKRETGEYVNLAGEGKTNYYIFTTTGRIYGVRFFKNIENETEGSD